MQGSAARSVVAYNLGRIGLFVGCAALGFLAGLRGLVLLAAALLISGILSWFLLARQRAAMAEALGGAVTRGRSRLRSAPLRRMRTPMLCSPIYGSPGHQRRNHPYRPIRT